MFPNRADADQIQLSELAKNVRGTEWGTNEAHAGLVQTDSKGSKKMIGDWNACKGYTQTASVGPKLQTNVQKIM